MRLSRISLFALMSLVVASGCSANRNAATSLRGERERIAEPPRHDHEYSPSLTPDEDDFVEPPSRSGEPAPAPPALGVSRVKSVSWLRDFGSRKRQAQTPDLNCSDEELIGQCSPIEPCVPNSECGPQPFGDVPPERCKQPGPLARIRKSMSQLLYRKPTLTNTTEYRDSSESRSCSTVETQGPRATVKHQEKFPPATRVPNTKTVPEARSNVGVLHPDCRKECLAEPLVESVFDPAEPGLIRPSDTGHFNSTPPAEPEFELPEQNSEIPSAEPELPSLPVPAIPSTEMQESAPTGFVEPQLWPKLQERAEVRSISQSVSQAITHQVGKLPPTAPAPTPSQSKTGSGEPILVMPKARR